MLSIVRRSQYACAGLGCEQRVCEDGTIVLQVCKKCLRTFYCGRACQKAVWKAECRLQGGRV